MLGAPAITSPPRHHPCGPSANIRCEIRLRLRGRCNGCAGQPWQIAALRPQTMRRQPYRRTLSRWWRRILWRRNQADRCVMSTSEEGRRLVCPGDCAGGVGTTLRAQPPARAVELTGCVWICPRSVDHRQSPTGKGAATAGAAKTAESPGRSYCSTLGSGATHCYCSGAGKGTTRNRAATDRGGGRNYHEHELDLAREI
eukprot:SAG22_NODE_3678_length_1581_cov_14.641700_1_plen_199_part_00